MKKIAFILLIFIALIPFAYGQDKLTLKVFHSPSCKVCQDVKDELFPQIKEKYKGQLELIELDTSDYDNFAQLLALTEKFEKEKPYIPAILIGNTFLMGRKDITNNLDKTIQHYIKLKPYTLKVQRIDLLDIFKKLSILTVAGSGLIDGINPCAFAVIVFFISFLAVYGYKKREIFYVGTAYCLAVFSTYLLIGLGFFNFLYKLNTMYLFIKGFYYFIAFFCFFLGLLAIYDYIRFKRTGASEEAILQLPKFLKRQINVVIGSRMRERKEEGVFSLLFTSFVVGFLVSLLEAVCTGQVYLPTIVFILKNTDLKVKAAAYLFLYNFMFILPLIAIFLLSLFGVAHIKFNTFLKRNLGRIKLGMALVFFILGALIFSMN